MKKPLLIVLAILILDQVSKIWVKTNMYIGQEYRIFDWFYIHFTENNGMAFGMEFAGEYGKLFLTIFRLAAVTALFFYMRSLIKDGAAKGLVTSIALIMAGALGNIIDSVFYGVIFDGSFHQVATFLPEHGGYSSIFYGRVVDMLYFPLFSGVFPQWVPFWGGEFFMFFRPVFNIADSAISIGVFIILLNQGRFFNPQKSATPEHSVNIEGQGNQNADSDIDGATK